LAAALGASKLVMLTDVAGVLDDTDTLISKITPPEARAMIADGTISGGMIPKIETCLDAVDHGVEAAHVLDGRLPHVLLLEAFTRAGVGTMIDAADD
jgi:acetylglutamate kinase